MNRINTHAKYLIIIMAFMLSPSAAAALVQVIEAQNMAIKNCANGKPVENGYCCLGPGYVAENVDFSGKPAALNIIAKGDYAGGAWPIMEVRINQVMVASIEVDSADWKSFELDLTGISLRAAPVRAGTHELAFAFINDWYKPDQSPPDRNFYLSKVTITQETEPTAAVTLAWNANDPADEIEGYKIYYGAMSRYDNSLDPVAILAECQKRCGSEPTQECLDSWANYCTAPDLLCDYDFFDYDQIVDVGNVLTHTLKLPAGHYFLAATAYNNKKYPESKFSVELDHTVTFNKPEAIKAPINFRYVKPITNQKELP